MVDNKILNKFASSFYISENYDGGVLSQRLCFNSYLSFGTVLAQNLVIGSIPAHRFWAVKQGPTREYKNDNLSVVQLGIQENYFFGFENINGVNFATKEKAFLDTLYFYQLGTRFSFNIYEDIHIDRLDKALINSYIEKYRNPKFKAFVTGVISAL